MNAKVPVVRDVLRSPRLVPVVVLTIAVLIAPFIISTYGLYLMSLVGVYAVGSIGLIILTGHGGLLNLGYSGFLALGAYVGGHLANEGQSIVLGLLAGLVAGLASGAVVGLFALWMGEFAIAIVTFGVGTFVALAVRELDGITGGLSGLAVIQMEPTSLFSLVWVVVGVAALVATLVLHGWFGRALRAMRDDIDAAAMFGLAPRRMRFLAFVVTAPFATVAGVLYGQTLGFISPEGFNIFMALGFIVIVILGGVTSVWGALIGSFLWVMVPVWTADVTGLYFILFGAVTLAVLRWAPDGVAGLVAATSRGLRRRLEGSHSSGRLADLTASAVDKHRRDNNA